MVDMGVVHQYQGCAANIATFLIKKKKTLSYRKSLMPICQVETSTVSLFCSTYDFQSYQYLRLRMVCEEEGVALWEDCGRVLRRLFPGGEAVTAPSWRMSCSKSRSSCSMRSCSAFISSGVEVYCAMERLPGLPVL